MSRNTYSARSSFVCNICRLMLISLLGLTSGPVAAESLSHPQLRLASERELNGVRQPLLHSEISQLHFLETGSGELSLLATGKDKVVQVWTLKPERGSDSLIVIPSLSKSCRWPIRQETGEILALAAMQNEDDSTWMAFGGRGLSSSLIQLENLRAGTTHCLIHPGNPKATLTALKFIPERKLLIAGYHDGNQQSQSSNSFDNLVLWKFDESAVGDPIHAHPVRTRLPQIDFIEYDQNRIVVTGRLRVVNQSFESDVAQSFELGNSLDPRTLLQNAVSIRLKDLRQEVTALTITPNDDFLLTFSGGLIRIPKAGQSISEPEWISPTLIFNRSARAIDQLRYRPMNLSDNGSMVTIPGSRLLPDYSYKHPMKNDSPEGITLWDSATNNYFKLPVGSMISLIQTNKGPLWRDGHYSHLVSLSGNSSRFILATANPDQSGTLRGRIRFMDPSFANSSDEKGYEYFPTQFDTPIQALAVSPDGKFVAATGVGVPTLNDGIQNSTVQRTIPGELIRIWSIRTRSLVAEISNFGHAVGHRIEKVQIVASDSSASDRPPVIEFAWPATIGQNAGNRLLWNAMDLDNLDPAKSIRKLSRANQPVPRVSPSSLQSLEIEYGPSICSTIFPNQKFDAIGYQYGAIGVWSREDVAKLQANGDLQKLSIDARRQAVRRLVTGFEGSPTCITHANLHGKPCLVWGTDLGVIHVHFLDEQVTRRSTGMTWMRKENRLKVTTVKPGSFAERDGLRIGDLIALKSNGGETIEQFEKRLEHFNAGDQIRIQVERGTLSSNQHEQRVHVEVVLAAIDDPTFSLYPVDDGGWVVWTPQGICAASKNTMKHMEWHINPDFAQINQEYDLGAAAKGLPPLDAFDIGPVTVLPGDDPKMVDRFRHRLILEDLVVQNDQKSFLENSRRLFKGNDANGYPVIRFTEPLPTETLTENSDLLKLSVQVLDKFADKSGNNEKGDVEIWLNCHRIVKSELADREKSGVQLRFNIAPDQLRNGTNSLICKSTGSNGVPVCEQRMIRYLRTDSKPKLHYLGVGVTKLDQPEQLGLDPLEYTAKDAAQIGDLLSGKVLAANCPFEKGQFVVLVDQEGVKTDQLPTKRNFLEELEKLKANVRPDDLLCIVIAAHGEGVEGRLQIITQDSQKIVSEDGSVSHVNSLSGDELNGALAAINCSQWVVLDTCFSGGISNSLKELSLSGRNVGPLIMTSSGGGTTSTALENKPHGAFSLGIIQALQRISEAEGPNSGTVLDVFRDAKHLVEVILVDDAGGAEAYNQKPSAEKPVPTLIRSIGFPQDGIRLRK
jgi:hypothetical protein